MYYIQYFKNYGGILCEACGDRAVVIIDGRISPSNKHMAAVECNGHHRPQYDGYQICAGESFTRSAPITGIINLGDNQ